MSDGDGGAETFLEALRTQAESWAAQGLNRSRRQVDGPVGPRLQVTGGASYLSFLSNDYLGLAAAPELRAAVAEGAMRWGAGSGSSALISGHLACHAYAEQALAEFVGAQSALLFITGYMANLAVVASLVQGSEDVVFSDQLNHASLIDGCRLSRARILRYRHRDLAELGRLLSSTPARRRLILTDGVFSMDGDVADLPTLLQLAEQHDALLVVDDAHGFGVLGPEGRGTAAAAGVASERLVQVGTLGKAAGLSGAFVAGCATVVDHLLQHARTYVFSTAPAPALAAAIPEALRLIRHGQARRDQLGLLRSVLRASSLGWQRRPVDSGTPILPVLVGEAGQTMGLAARLAERGVLVAGIRPPTVPEGSSRLRISLSAAHAEEDVRALWKAGVAVGL